MNGTDIETSEYRAVGIGGTSGSVTSRIIAAECRRRHAIERWSGPSGAPGTVSRHGRFEVFRSVPIRRLTMWRATLRPQSGRHRTMSKPRRTAMSALGSGYYFLIDDSLRASDQRKADEWRRLHQRPDALPLPETAANGGPHGADREPPAGHPAGRGRARLIPASAHRPRRRVAAQVPPVAPWCARYSSRSSFVTTPAGRSPRTATRAEAPPDSRAKASSSVARRVDERQRPVHHLADGPLDDDRVAEGALEQALLADRADDARRARRPRRPRTRASG